MSEEVSVAYYCPYCEREATLIISAESPTDYHVVDECCPNCDAQIEGGVVDKLAYDAVADHFAIQGGWVKDIENDLD